MLAKIAFASENYFEREDLVEGTAEDLLLSVAMDYPDLHGQEARASPAGRIAEGGEARQQTRAGAPPGAP
jgi:hypothetical protein